MIRNRRTENLFSLTGQQTEMVTLQLTPGQHVRYAWHAASFVVSFAQENSLDKDNGREAEEGRMADFTAAQGLRKC